MAFIPEPNQAFYMINSRFEVVQSKFTKSEKSRKRVEAGNCFKTQEDAEAFRQYVLKGSTQVKTPTKIKVTDMSQEAIDIHYASLLLNNSMNHATDVIKYASMVIAAGPVNGKQQIRNIVDNFKNIHKQYAERETKLIENYERYA